MGCQSQPLRRGLGPWALGKSLLRSELPFILLCDGATGLNNFSVGLYMGVTSGHPHMQSPRLAN